MPQIIVVLATCLFWIIDIVLDWYKTTTRVNPNSKYAQIVSGEDGPFSQGIVDAYGLTNVKHWLG